MTLDAQILESPHMKMICRKVIKNNVTTCHLSSGFVPMEFLCLNEMVTGWIDLRGSLFAFACYGGFAPQ